MSEWGTRNKGTAASLPSVHMPFRYADTGLRNSRKPTADKAGQGLTHHGKSGDFPRWVRRFCDSVITKSPRFAGCHLPRTSKARFSTSKRHMYTQEACSRPFISLVHPAGSKMIVRWRGLRSCGVFNTFDGTQNLS